MSKTEFFGEGFCNPVVETSLGKIRGFVNDDVFVFKGVPYASGTGGAKRFMAPQPTSWPGVRDASAFGPRSPQNIADTDRPYLTWLRDKTTCGEDCLVLNVFTPSLAQNASLPVMVYLHGGAFASGSAGAQGLDGSNLARRDVVVVTVNHRLNLFGFLYLGDDEGGEYTPNVGMLDLVAALEWVKQNVAQFGGNPRSVTIFGQSGGGSKVATLMAMPSARGLFHKAIVQSASSLLKLATLEDADRNTHHFFKAMGLNRTKVRSLNEQSAEVLLRTMRVAIRESGGRDNYRPVVDGRIVLSQPFETEAITLSADVPLITGWCENEQRLTIATSPEVFECDSDVAMDYTSRALCVDRSDCEGVIDVYRNSRPTDSPGDLYAQIYGDFRYRQSVTRAAELKVKHGGAPAYLYMLSWKSPVLHGLLRSAHTLCIPFVFSNTDIAQGITGAGHDRYALQEEMVQAWVSFARCGDPNHHGMSTWPAYSTEQRLTMIFDRHTRVVNDPLSAERVALSVHKPYDPALGEGRLR